MIHLARRMPRLPKREHPLIFVVDDSVDSLKLYALILERAQLGTVTCFSSPTMALEAINAQRPDVVLSDLAMPGMWGTELYQEVYSHRANRPIRWVFMSPASQHLTDAHRLPADGFLLLPCHPRTIVETVASLLSARYSAFDSQKDDT